MSCRRTKGIISINRAVPNLVPNQLGVALSHIVPMYPHGWIEKLKIRLEKAMNCNMCVTETSTAFYFTVADTVIVLEKVSLLQADIKGSNFNSKPTSVAILFH